MEYRRYCNQTFEQINKETIQVTRDDNSNYIVGYFAKWYDNTPSTEYRLLDNVTERISRTAFDDVIASGDEIQMWANHNPDSMIATTVDGSLKIYKDGVGWLYRIAIDETDPDIMRIKKKIEKGYVSGSSFQGSGESSLQRIAANTYIRTIDKINRLIEVSILTKPHKPAYASTEASLRHQISNWEEVEKRIKRTKLR